MRTDPANDPSARRRRPPAALFAGIACLVAAALLAAGCSTKSASGDSAIHLPDGKADTSGVTLRFGDQNQLLQSVLRASGALSGADYRVTFSQFTDGPHMYAAFSADRIDAGWLGDTPAIYANAAKAGVTLLSSSITGGTSGVYDLVTRPGLRITSVADLKGKKVALTRRTALEGYVIKVLATAGLTEDDIEVVDLPILSIVSAVSSGQVDVGVGVPPASKTYLASHPDNRVTPPQVPLNLVVLGAKRALTNPAKEAALEDFIGRLATGEVWLKNHKSEFIQAYYVDTLKVPASLGEDLFNVSAALTVSPIATSGLRANVEGQYKAFVALGSLPKDPPVSQLFDKQVIARFDPIVARAIAAGGAS